MQLVIDLGQHRRQALLSQRRIHASLALHARTTVTLVEGNMGVSGSCTSNESLKLSHVMLQLC